MRSIPPALLSHAQQPVTTLTVLWTVTRRDGLVLRGTTHDQDVTVSSGPRAGVYLAQGGMRPSSIRSNADLAVDNLEVEGPLADGLSLVNLRAVDIEAGLFDGAEFEMLLANWAAPDDGQYVLKAGKLGEPRYVVEGRYTVELRGVAQDLAQNIVRTYSVTCDAELGDARCKLNLAPLTRAGEVTAVTSRRRFLATIVDAGTAGTYDGGLLSFTSGANAGFSREVRRDRVGLTIDIDVFEPFPAAIEIGDEFTIRPGCRKTADACKAFANFANFRGHGVFVPGQTEVLKIGGQ